MNNYQIGQQYFLPDGRIVILEDITSSGKYLCSVMLEIDGDDGIIECKGEVLVAEKILVTEPEQQRGPLIRAALESLEKIKAEHAVVMTDLSAKKQEAHQILTEYNAAISKLKQMPALKRIEDFISGKITHFVICGHGDVKIAPFAEAMMENSDRWNKPTKLLTLFGETSGELQWRINRYSDGSGSNHDVIPATSLEDANEAAAGYISAQIKSDFDAGRFYHLAKYIALAEGYGIKVPDNVVEKSEAHQVDTKKKRAVELRRYISTNQAELTALGIEENTHE
jgi:hypothetical protein